MKIKPHLGYTILAFGYIVGIFILSDLPGGGGGLIDSAPRLYSKLGHICLFAGLAWCLLIALSGGQWRQIVPDQVYGVIGFLAGMYAAFDEWHQSFVPGRFASINDVLLDVVGIAALLLLHRATRRLTIAA